MMPCLHKIMQITLPNPYGNRRKPCPRQLHQLLSFSASLAMTLKQGYFAYRRSIIQQYLINLTKPMASHHLVFAVSYDLCHRVDSPSGASLIFEILGHDFDRVLFR